MNGSLREKHYHIVLERLRSLMTEEGMDALITFKNENVTYINTLPSSFLSLSNVATLAMIIVPREGDVVGICCDFERPALTAGGMVRDWREFPMWIYIDDQFITDHPAKRTDKPEFFSLELSIGVLVDCLKAAGAEKGTLGVETIAIQMPIWQALQQALPDATFVDSSALFYKARAIKTDYEIECLRIAARAQEDIVFETMAEIDIGTSHADIISRLSSRALAAPHIESIRMMFVSIGPLFAPCMSPYEVAVQDGDLIKYDGALVVRGYGADAARTFIAGKPSADQERVNTALTAAHKKALSMMGPGVIPKDVFNEAMRVAHDNGLPNFMRGHVGHSVGLDHTVEEPPFLSPLSVEPMIPGNVFCVELPYYAHNFGSIMNEDIVVITENGTEFLTSSEVKLHPIGTQRK
jgi:Xaa-Pro aminopeptidase